MSIQSTHHITRDYAISRILSVHEKIIEHDYNGIKKMSCGESGYSPDEFVKDHLSLDVTYIHNWTNEMLEEQMDKPFFRCSIFENYLIKDGG